MVFMMTGYWVRRGSYSTEDVQVFNQGRVGGRYWFSDGVNWRDMAAWIPSAVVGLLFANYPPLIEGPFRNATGGVDISLPMSLDLAAVVYLPLLFAFPEPRYVFGPAGPRLVPARESAMPPVTDDPRASVHRVGRRSPLQPSVEPADR
ncbi:cytosine permease [Geodermatophilus sp. SYSU D01176]